MSDSEGRGWAAAAAFAAAQHGVVTSGQLSDFLTRHQVTRLIDRGHLAPTAFAGVWRIAGSVATWRQRLMTCCLAGGEHAVASHTSAARLLGLRGVAVKGMEVTIPRHRSQRWSTGRSGDVPLVRIHPTDLPDDHVKPVERIPVTTVARTLLDVSGTLAPDALAAVIDDALRRNLVTLNQLSATRSHHQARGARRFDAVLRLRTETSSSESVWEDRLWKWIAAAGLPLPTRQFTVALPCGLVRLDMAYPKAKIAIEFDGFMWHRARQQFDRDRLRISQLSIAGWMMVAITSAQSEAAAVDLVRQALVERGWTQGH